MLPALLTMANQGLMDMRTLVRMACENPAKIYGVKNKGHLKEGYDADLVLVDPQRRTLFQRSMVASKCGWSPYEGAEFVGWPIHVWLRGLRVVEENSLAERQSGSQVKFDWK